MRGPPPPPPPPTFRPATPPPPPPPPPPAYVQACPPPSATATGSAVGGHGGVVDGQHSRIENASAQCIAAIGTRTCAAPPAADTRERSMGDHQPIQGHGTRRDV